MLHVVRGRPCPLDHQSNHPIIHPIERSINGLTPSTDKLTAMAWLVSEPLYCCVYKSSSTTFAVCSTPDCPSIPGYTLASSSPVQDCGSCKAPTGAASIRIIAEDEH